jgi:C_GCAxxG_C_C family probable redox protein
MKELINERVHEYYWNQNLNCAITTLNILSELFHVELQSQIKEAAIGMNGAGRFGSQCGLVEGSLMFIGIYGSKKEMDKSEIIELCHRFSSGFQQKFGSLLCRDLRPEGFHPDNPPHLCEKITQLAVLFVAEFILKEIERSIVQ